MAPFNEALGVHLTVPVYPLRWFDSVLDHPELPAEIPYKTMEWYLEGLGMNGFVEIQEGQQQPADLVVSKMGELVYVHGGLIVNWPDKIIHCTSRGHQKSGVQLVSARGSYYYGRGELKFFSWKAWHEPIL